MKGIKTRNVKGRGSIGICAKSGKFQYETEELARKAAKDFKKAHKVKLQQYVCWHCNLWHNGHNRGGKYEKG